MPFLYFRAKTQRTSVQLKHYYLQFVIYFLINTYSNINSRDNDIIIFSNGTKSSLKRITNFLVEYEQCSGQKVNSSKSGFILSARASLSRASVVGGALGFPSIRLPTKYLGMPLYKGPKKSFLWDDLISKIAARMEGWEAKVLSPGGYYHS